MTLSLRLAAVAVFVVFASGASAQDALVGAPQLYPNPVAAGQTLSVVSDAPGATVEVIDMLGRQVDASALAAGTYLARLSYADGRVSTPSRFTMLSAGALELRVVSEATAPLAPEAAVQTTEQASAPNKGGCPTLFYGGKCHQAFQGLLIPRSFGRLGVRPNVTMGGASRVSDYNVDLGSVYGFSFRYNGPAETYPLQVLTLGNAPNSQLTYQVNYTNDGASEQALLGPFEVTFDDDGAPGTAPIFALQVGFSLTSTPSIATEAPQAPSNKGVGGGGYEYIILNDGVVVARDFASDTTPIFAVDPSGSDRIYLENTVLMTRLVDGFEVEGGSKPGDVSAVFGMANRDGDPVTFHIGEGGMTTAVGDVIHITPAISQPNLSSFVFNSVRTYGNQTKRYRVRALRVAAGLSFFGGPPPRVTKAGFPSGGAPWSRNAGEHTDSQASSFIDAQNPTVFVGYSGMGNAPASFGVAWGSEPVVLDEVSSSFMAVYHDFPFAVAAGDKGIGGPYVINASGEFHEFTSRIRNRSDNQNERVTTRWFIDGAGDLTLNVGSATGSFSTYEFVYIRNGNVQQVNNYSAGADVTFGVGELAVFASASGTFFGGTGSTTGEEYGVGYLLDTPISGDEEVYIYPHFTTLAAEVDTRSVAVQTDQAHIIDSVDNASAGGPIIMSAKARTWTALKADR